MSRECDALLANTSAAENKPVGITADVMKVTVQHKGRDVDIMRI